MQPLLLLHGAIGAKDQLEPLKQVLAGHFEVHTLSFLGHGEASAIDIFSIATFSQQVSDYIDAKGLKQVLIFGYSMGGYVATHLALQANDKVAGLFTLGTKWHWDEETSTREVKMLDADKIAAKIPAFAKALAHRHGADNWKSVLANTRAMMLDMGANPPLQLDQMQALEIPAMVALGDRDTMVSLEETVAAFKHFPQAQFQVFPNTPHPIEKVDVTRLAREIKAFFEGLN